MNIFSVLRVVLVVSGCVIGPVDAHTPAHAQSTTDLQADPSFETDGSPGRPGDVSGRGVTFWQAGTGNWSTGANWSNGEPGSDDWAYINNSGTSRSVAEPRVSHILPSADSIVLRGKLL